MALWLKRVMAYVVSQARTRYPSFGRHEMLQAPLTRIAWFSTGTADAFRQRRTRATPVPAATDDCRTVA